MSFFLAKSYGISLFFLSLRACIVGMPSDMTYFRLSDPQRLSKYVSHAGMSDNCKHFARKKNTNRPRQFRTGRTVERAGSPPVTNSDFGRISVHTPQIRKRLRGVLPPVRCHLRAPGNYVPRRPTFSLSWRHPGLEGGRGSPLSRFFFIIIFDKLR